MLVNDDNMKQIKGRIASHAGIDERQLLAIEINKWLKSDARQEMIAGERYYRGYHDILRRKRTAIGANGELQEVKNLPNNRIIDNQYAKMVSQKNNYLLGQPIIFEADDPGLTDLLDGVFDRRFQRTALMMGRSALNHGLSWLYPYYDEEGKLRFKRFDGYTRRKSWRQRCRNL